MTNEVGGIKRYHRLNRGTVIEVLQYLFLEGYPDEPLVLVLGNAPFHHVRDTLAFLSLFEHRVRVIWLPKYAPRFWQHLKRTVCAHRLIEAIEQLWQDVVDFMRLQNTPSYPERILFSNYFP